MQNSIGEQIRALLLQSIPHRVIRGKIKCSSATISYHARKLGLEKQKRPAYDWLAIQKDIAAGMSMYGAIAKYGFSKATWHTAVKTGKITKQKRFAGYSLDELITAFHGKRLSPYQKRLFRRHIAKEQNAFACSECGLGEWRGKKLSLELDHISGNPKDNRRENLRLLCPNCHCTTPTWRGRNVKHPLSRFES